MEGLGSIPVGTQIFQVLCPVVPLSSVHRLQLSNGDWRTEWKTIQKLGNRACNFKIG